MTCLVEATATNAAFSHLSPGLQLAIDSHSLGAFKTCPRWYYYTIVLGLQPRAESVHLTFGLLMHKAREVYYKARAAGAGYEEAVEAAVSDALISTYNPSLRRPWISDDPNKNRWTLLRTIIWYLDKYKNDAIETATLADGTAATELHFQFDSGFRTKRGEVWEFCGWIDRIGTLNGLAYIDDLKTSKNTIGQFWFDKFTPFNQFSMYVTAGQVVWKVPVQGLIVDGVQVAVTFSRFERGLVPRPAAVVAEWIEAQGFWLKQMEQAAEAGAEAETEGRDAASAWPMNDTSCDRYGGCPARKICARAPGARAAALAVEFKRKIWDPTKERTEA